MELELRVATCGDCIHADVCERIPFYTEFSRSNPACCKDFKNTQNLAPVVRCKDCKWLYDEPDDRLCLCVGGLTRITPDTWCCYGERRNDA